MIAQRWKLPADLDVVLANHHEGQVAGQRNDLTAIVTIGEEMSRDLGYGINIGAGGCDHVNSEVLGRAYKSLNLDDEAWRELSGTARKLADALGAEMVPWRKAATSAADAPKAEATSKPSPAYTRPVVQQARRSWWFRLRRALGV
jgi:hypothetical protein